jgi:agmatine/peptidylarginine deiminase
MLTLALAHVLAATPAAGAFVDLSEGHVLRARRRPQRTLVGDYEPPDAVLMTYTSSWPETFTALAAEIAARTNVFVMVEEGDEIADVVAWIGGLDLSLRARVWPFHFVTDTPWVRDYGPLQVRERKGRVLWLDADYSMWRPFDDVVPFRLAEELRVDVEFLQAPIDGGAVASNGQGLCVSTIEYFAENELPYPHAVSRWRDRAQVLLRAVGCRVLALVPALSNEGTGHADVLVQFLDPHSVAVALFDPVDALENAMRMETAIETIDRAARMLGIDLDVHGIHVPADEAGVYFQYVNSLRLGDALLVPSYTGAFEEEEQEALADWAAALPDVQIVPVPAQDLWDAEGGIHCAALGLHLGRKG